MSNAASARAGDLVSGFATAPARHNRVSRIRLSVEDTTGQELRLLGDQSVPAGLHHWVWNGVDDQDDQDERLPSGVYTVHLAVRDPDMDVILLDEADVILMAILDVRTLQCRNHRPERAYRPDRLQAVRLHVRDRGYPGCGRVRRSPRGWTEITPTMLERG